MKKKVFAVATATVLALSLSLGLSMPVAADPDATISIGDISVLPSATITVPVIAQDVDSADAVCQAGIDLQFDPAVVNVTNVVKGDIPAGSFIFDWEVFTNDVATYNMDFSNIYSGDFSIALITFQAVGNPGDSCALTFGNYGNRFLGTFLADFGGTGVDPLVFDNGTFTILSPNQPPDCSGAFADPCCLWPPNHKFVDVNIMGVTDPDGDAFSITIDGITSDEPTATYNGSGGAKHAPDATGVGTDTASVRAERSGNHDGRVYVISFTATDDSGNACSGTVTVKVSHDQSGDNCPAVDSGQQYDATLIN